MNASAPLAVKGKPQAKTRRRAVLYCTAFLFTYSLCWKS
jgi:hypothetical protein